MAYQIISQNPSEDGNTIITVVKFDFINKNVTIPHFKPEDQDAIELGISNREITEKKKLGLLPPDVIPEVTPIVE